MFLSDVPASLNLGGYEMAIKAKRTKRSNGPDVARAGTGRVAMTLPPMPHGNTGKKRRKVRVAALPTTKIPVGPVGPVGRVPVVPDARASLDAMKNGAAVAEEAIGARIVEEAKRTPVATPAPFSGRTYSYTRIGALSNGQGGHFRIADDRDNGIGSSYLEENARLIVAALNAYAMAPVCPSLEQVREEEAMVEAARKAALKGGA
jgi:hypothetical protein